MSETVSKSLDEGEVYNVAFAMYTHYNFVRFASRKTPIIEVWETYGKGERIGTVKWYTPKHQYVFLAREGMMYRTTYLREIANFCERMTKKEMQEWRRSKNE
jgi:hypothetical protein